MAGPGWLTGLLAAVMLTVAAYHATRLVAAYSATRLVAAPRWNRAAELDADGVHVVMGVAMAGMLAPALSFAPARLWQAFFAAAGAWFAWQSLRARPDNRQGTQLGPRRCPHPLPHLIECAAMVLMLALPAAVASTGASATTGMGAMTGTVTAAAARFSPLTLLLALFMIGYVMWLGNNLTALASGFAGCCRIAMGVTMGYMLVVML